MEELHSPENSLHEILDQVEGVVIFEGLEIFDADEEELAVMRNDIGLLQNTTLIVVESERGLTQIKLNSLSENIAALSSSLCDVKFAGEEKMTVGYIIITPKIN